MLFSMLVSLYTSRVVLNVLGIDDFGIFSVVGGIVMMFAFLNAAMANGTQRFLSVEIAQNNLFRLKQIFSMGLNTHYILAIIIIILAETVGLWFLNTYMNITPGRLSAANWVYQFSIFSFVVTIISVPYNAAIIAYERMNVFAYIGIIEVTLKLAIVFMLQWFDFDKLKTYAVLTFCVTLLIRIIYQVYCRKKIKECSYSFLWDKNIFKEMFSVSGWNFFGGFSLMLSNQGINIILNIFFGVVVNAARGIAFQVQSAINSFVSSFQTAMNPQIIKSYAAKDFEYMRSLIYNGAKYSFFLVFILSLPIIIEAEFILSWWLKKVPEYSVLFVRLILINAIIDSLSGTLMTASLASGKIKKYQLVVSGILSINMPICLLLFSQGFPPQYAFYTSIVVSILALSGRLWLVSRLVPISIKDYLKHVISRVLVVSLLSPIIPFVIYIALPTTFISVVLVCFVSLLTTTSIIYFGGLNASEKTFLTNIVRNKISRKNNS